MKKFRWELLTVLILIAISCGLYGLHFHLFHDKHHLIIYGLGDLAFLPLEVFLVSLVLHRLLEFREKKSQQSKMNMLIGSFFSEVGNKLLREIAGQDRNMLEHGDGLKVRGSWKEREFHRAIKKATNYKPALHITEPNLDCLKTHLLAQRQYLNRLVQNPVLLEHGLFTDLLLASFHLLEELSYRDSFTNLSQNDKNHLDGDIERVYTLLISEWICYAKHLKFHYAYLFSLAVRVNPLKSKIDVKLK